LALHGRAVRRHGRNGNHQRCPQGAVGDLHAEIACAFYIALELLGSDTEPLSIAGSWRDALDDTEVLSVLREYNTTGSVLHQSKPRRSLNCHAAMAAAAVEFNTDVRRPVAGSRSRDGFSRKMTVLLVAALQAAETLAAHHRGRIEQTRGQKQAHHEQMHRRCLEDIEDIMRQLAASGVTVQNQARAIRSRDVETAQRVVAAHLLPEWRASEEAPQAMEALAQAIADAMQTARGGSTLPWCSPARR
jgi:hypothetical protein